MIKLEDATREVEITDIENCPTFLGHDLVCEALVLTQFDMVELVSQKIVLSYEQSEKLIDYIKAILESKNVNN